MASNVNVKMGVSGVAQFKQGMKDSQAAVKNLDQQLKLNEQQLKLNGDAEVYLQNKAELLEKQIKQQQDVVRQAEAALSSMRKNEVEPTSAAYQNMQKASYAAQTELLRMRTELQNIGTAGEEAETGVGNMNDELQNIGRGISWQNVTSGIEKITEKLEAAAKKAYRLGKAIVSATLEGGQWADELATEAEMYEMSPEQLYRMRQTANVIDTEVDTIIGARKKLITAMGQNDNKETMGAFAALGINYLAGSDDNIERVFWKAGEGLMQMEDKVARNEYAMKLYGRSWEELIPIFKTGRDEYEKTMAEWTWVGDEQFENLTELNDAQMKMNSEWEALKRQFEGTMADVMTPIMETLTALMKEFNTYLQSDEGQQMLKDLGDAISGLFSDLENIKPEEVISGIKDAVNELKKGLEWLKNNGESVKSAIIGIAGAFALMKIGGVVSNVLQLVNGLKGLTGGNATGGSGGGPTVIPTGAGKSILGGIGKAGVAALMGYPMIERIMTEGWDFLNPWSDYYKKSATADALDIIGGAGTGDIYNKIMNGEAVKKMTPQEEYVYWAEQNELAQTNDRLAQVAGEMTTKIGDSITATTDMSAAVRIMETLPADMRSAVESAVISGMSQVTIIVDDRGMNAMTDRISGGMGQAIMQLVN